jgi:sulfur transfer complex TusBCD TusB component (DsrH family)
VTCGCLADSNFDVVRLDRACEQHVEAAISKDMPLLWGDDVLKASVGNQVKGSHQAAIGENPITMYALKQP